MSHKTASLLCASSIALFLLIGLVYDQVLAAVPVAFLVAAIRVAPPSPAVRVYGLPKLIVEIASREEALALGQMLVDSGYAFGDKLIDAWYAERKPFLFRLNPGQSEFQRVRDATFSIYVLTMSQLVDASRYEFLPVDHKFMQRRNRLTGDIDNLQPNGTWAAIARSRFSSSLKLRRCFYESLRKGE